VLLEIFANPDRFAALVSDGHQQVVPGLIQEILVEGQKRREVRPDLDTAVAALTIIAGSALIGAQAVTMGIDPGEPVTASLEVNWKGIAS
jgi:hypothetical protein